MGDVVTSFSALSLTIVLVAVVMALVSIHRSIDAAAERCLPPVPAEAPR